MRMWLIVVVVVLMTACSSGSGVVVHVSAPQTSGAASSPSPTNSSTPPTYPDWPTYHGDAERTGVAASMPPAAGAPIVKYALTLGGAVYASPLVVDGITVVATEHDSVFGLDAAGRQLWRTDLGTPAAQSQLPCGNIDPLGITGTPVYDPSTKLVYLVAEYGGPPRHELVALSPMNGSVSWRVSVDLPGVNDAAMQERGALTVADGSVWVPFGGLDGDCGAYKGRLVGVPLNSAHTPSAFTVPTAREGGIWTPPGPSVDSAGHLFVSVGNGASGVGDSYDHSDSVLKLDGTTLIDSFSPTTWATDNDADKDLGSQGPALIGDQWIFIDGKSGTAYLLRQGQLGGIGGQVSSARICTSFGGTAVSGTVVYVPCTDGVRAVQITATGAMQVLWHADTAVTGSPVVGGGRVWSLDPAHGVLYALDPATGKTVGQVNVGVASRFATPAISGPDLIIPTLTGLTTIQTS
jgi:outer membrane protein assembly factor BamB